jgi:hypothetical protein
MIQLDIIQFIHILLIVFIIFVPLTNNINLIRWNLIILSYLLIRSLTGNDYCGLTILEYKLLNKKYEEGFIYRFLKPIITIRETKFNKYITFVTLLIFILNYSIYTGNIS